MNTRLVAYRVVTLLSAALSLAVAGCGDDEITRPPDTSAPGTLVTADLAGSHATFWPYTTASLDSAAADPINLVFAGKADPVQVRAALLALDGDRTALGFPDAYPFNARWSDAIGDAQGAYASGAGWCGSVIQLQLGDYGPVRFHLRLFRTDAAFPGGGTWTLGNAHFEVLVPGTADHQVLSWEKAEEIVVADLMRSGLLDATQPFVQTGVVNASGTYRSIPPEIYSPLPDDIKGYIEGPLGSVTEPVGIKTDGRTTILHLTGTAAPATGSVLQSFPLTYGQLIPKPFCSTGSGDLVYVEGPVEFRKTVTVDAPGHYAYHSEAAGSLTVTPWDAAANAPSGAPYTAVVSDVQSGSIDASLCTLSAQIQRISSRPEGSEVLLSNLDVTSGGPAQFTSHTTCLSP